MNYFVAAWFYLAGCMMAWTHYPAMLAVAMEDTDDGTGTNYLLVPWKLYTCVLLWPVVEVANECYEFYLKYLKKGGTDAQ